MDVNGVGAVAGIVSAMTHGSYGYAQVIAHVGKPWGKIRLRAVSGWVPSVKRMAKGGQHITWTNLGEPQPFSNPSPLPPA